MGKADVPLVFEVETKRQLTANLLVGLALGAFAVNTLLYARGHNLIWLALLSGLALICASVFRLMIPTRYAISSRSLQAEFLLQRVVSIRWEDIDLRMNRRKVFQASVLRRIPIFDVFGRAGDFESALLGGLHAQVQAKVDERRKNYVQIKSPSSWKSISLLDIGLYLSVFIGFTFVWQLDPSSLLTVLLKWTLTGAFITIFVLSMRPRSMNNDIIGCYADGVIVDGKRRRWDSIQLMIPYKEITQVVVTREAETGICLTVINNWGDEHKMRFDYIDAEIQLRTLVQQAPRIKIVNQLDRPAGVALPPFRHGEQPQ